MKRRNFLALLGIAPVAAACTKIPEFATGGYAVTVTPILVGEAHFQRLISRDGITWERVE